MTNNPKGTNMKALTKMMAGAAMAIVVMAAPAGATTVTEVRSALSDMTAAMTDIHDDAMRGMAGFKAMGDDCSNLSEAALTLMSLNRPSSIPVASWKHTRKAALYAELSAEACIEGVDNYSASSLRTATDYITKVGTEMHAATCSTAMSELAVPTNPCASCPYRLDHPSGVWEHGEYEKLRSYDPVTLTWPNGQQHEVPSPDVAVFHCHQENATGVETVCKGWLDVHPESIAVRLAVAKGLLPPEAPYEGCSVPLHVSGAAAADAGQAEYEKPGADAQGMVSRLVRKGAGK